MKTLSYVGERSEEERGYWIKSEYEHILGGFLKRPGHSYEITYALDHPNYPSIHECMKKWSLNTETSVYNNST